MLLGWFFRPFNRFFAWATSKYSAGVARVIRVSTVALFVYEGLVFLTGVVFRSVPVGFIPDQDKQYLICVAQLPDAASLDRTDAVVKKMTEMALAVPGVEASVAFPGLSPNGFTASPNSGITFISLKPFEERRSHDLSAAAIQAKLMELFGQIQEARCLVINAPPVNGLSTGGGFKLYVEDRANLGQEALYNTTWATICQAYATNVLQGIYSTYQINVPQLAADVDRVKAKSQGVPLQNLFKTMQIYLGSLYVNDFNRFGRTYQVIAQADAPFRSHFDDLGKLIKGSDNNIFTQIGLIVLVGLACKNAILIVEFAREKQQEGKGIVESALEACRLRLRPILMTSIAFIAGVYPLVTSHGAGAEMRQAMGVAVFAGMIGVTFFGLFLTPVFYVVIMKLVARFGTKKPSPLSTMRPGLGAVAPGH